MKKKEILRRIKKEVCEVDPSATIFLYGSRARGDNSEYSDWDLLILLETIIDEQQKDEIIDNLFDLELESNQIFSPIIHNNAEWEKLKPTSFYKNVKSEGIRI